MSKETKSNLPANISNMATALATSAATVGGGAMDGELYCRFTKTGDWIYGIEDTEVEEDSTWAVNVAQFQHGFIAWPEGGGAPTGEVLVPATQPMPNQAELPEVDGTWSKCVAVQMRCMSGEDEGVQIIWKANSTGGRKAYAKLLKAVVDRIQSGDEAVVPIVTLGSDSYKHKQYGKIYTPEITISGWVTMDGAEESASGDDAEEAVEEAEEKPTRRRRRRAA
jgi:hypothetical protein